MNLSTPGLPGLGEGRKVKLGISETVFSPREDDMKQLGIALIVLAASAGSAMAADSPFAGTWKLNADKSKYTGTTFTYAKTPAGYRYSNGATVAYSFGVDGKDYPTVADRTTAWTKNADGSWDSVAKANGTVLAKSHRSLSAGGAKLMVSTTVYRADGTTVDEKDVFDRVSGAKGLAGKWRDVKASGGADTMTISTPSAGRFEIDDPIDKETTAGPTDGTPVEVKGPTAPPGLMISRKAVGAHKWDTVTTLKGKVYAHGVMTVSADGKTLTDISWVPGKEAEKSVDTYDKQ